MCLQYFYRTYCHILLCTYTCVMHSRFKCIRKIKKGRVIAAIVQVGIYVEKTVGMLDAHIKATIIHILYTVRR